MLDPIIILIALAGGLASRALGLPALIGYLAAGFVLHETNIQGGELLQELANLGVTLLLLLWQKGRSGLHNLSCCSKGLTMGIYY